MPATTASRIASHCHRSTKPEPMTSSKLVYSTGGVNTCPRCGKRLDKCRCQSARQGTAGSTDGVVRISREVKGRGGKEVTVISGLPEPQLKALSKTLKAACGTGGSCKQGNIELQGDRRQQAQSLLQGKGFTVKLAGG